MSDKNRWARQSRRAAGPGEPGAAPEAEALAQDECRARLCRLDAEIAQIKAENHMQEVKIEEVGDIARAHAFTRVLGNRGTIHDGQS